ncbi:MAG TPA: ABC transporter ATP-binding protein [Jiangellaceae bacterium]
MRLGISPTVAPDFNVRMVLMLEVTRLDAFHGHAQALWDVSLNVSDGEIVSVIGPNGAGKSTLVTAIAGLLRPINGQITLDGVDLGALPAHHVCRCAVAIVPEGRRIFAHMTVRENLLLGAHRRDARKSYEETLGRVLELFPRLGERSGQQAMHLSGGEQQMLAIGRALMAKPRLLLLDEPSLGLAPVVVDEVFAAIETISRDGVGVLLVEQEVERALQIANRGYLLGEGRVVTSGDSDSLRHDDAVRHSVLGL